jgi:ribose/xylose/arabinose/galactoside ABC-type transport system permease subunit/ABC-type sugar transport system substrate-binding protein
VRLDRRTASALIAAALAAPAMAELKRPRTLAILFDSLTSTFWQASLAAMKTEAASRGWVVLEAVSNADDNRQYGQVQSMLRRRVDAIVIVQTDAKAVIPAIRAANAAGTPMVHFNRAPAPSDAYSVAVVADNRAIMRDTVAALIDAARARGGRYQAAVLIGDLGDPNAAQRLAGFQEVIDRNRDLIDVVARISTEWNADKAFAGLTNALQAHPDINLLVSSSDFLAPQIEQALRAAGKWHPAGESGHVLIASFDGDASAYAMLAAGYFDVDGVQNLSLEVKLAFDAVVQMWQGLKPPKIVLDPGLIVQGETLDAQRDQMWGYTAANLRHAAVVRSGAVKGVIPARTSGNLALFLLAVGSFMEALLSAGTARDILLAALPLAILVAGQMLVLIAGQIDLSMTAVMALCSVVGASVMSRCDLCGEPLHTASGVLVSLALGLVIGAFNGMCTALLRMPSFIVTLAVLMFGGGTAIWYASVVSDTVSIGGLPPAFIALGYGSIDGVPLALLLCAMLLLTVHWMLSRTLWGRWLHALGHNVRAARIAGVPVHRMTISAFAASGFCAALAAVIETARLESGQPTLGQNMLLDIIGATVIGGVSLFGGRGTVAMVMGGVLFLSVLDKSLQLLGMSLFMALAIKGLAILIAAALDATRRRRSSLT